MLLHVKTPLPAAHIKESKPFTPRNAAKYESPRHLKSAPKGREMLSDFSKDAEQLHTHETARISFGNLVDMKGKRCDGGSLAILAEFPTATSQDVAKQATQGRQQLPTSGQSQDQ